METRIHSARITYPLKRRLSLARCHARGYASSKLPQRLRILYCGSDDFSVASLRKLHDKYTKKGDGLIESLDVVVRAGKPSGRGLKQVRDAPIRAVADELGLKCHGIPTFTGWTPPAGINLVTAVSFGLKIPRRILEGAVYGGLNLHPSLLPDLRGPAPLHHALLQGRKSTGITLQTLHPEHFDQGEIVAQRPFDIPKDGECNFKELYDYSAKVAGNFLVESLINGSFLHSNPQPDVSNEHLTHARKVTPEDAHVDWQTWPLDRILRTQRALGQVWSHFHSPNGWEPRVQWHDVRRFEPSSEVEGSSTPGRPFLNKIIAPAFQEKQANQEAGNDLAAVMPTCDGHLLSIDTVTIEGRPRHERADKGVRILLQGRP